MIIFWLQPNTSEILYIDETIKKCKNLLSVRLIICIWIHLIAIYNRLPRKNEKKREMRINYLGLGFQQCMGFRTTVRWTAIKHGVSVKGGVGVYLFVKECCFRVRVTVKVRVGVTVGVMVKGMLGLGLMSTLTLNLKQPSLRKAKR